MSDTTTPPYATATMSPAELVDLLDETDPVVLAFDALVILNSQNVPPAPAGTW
ncbi:hypothetical protein [Streptomyces sp. NBC_00687]|uniref:hypothetical protein n=1 Tax=Streptomyces sp. NBC_00687 TaxID=2975807 RepID=UPI002256BEFC|nr:hypothetical protein [Streptomyces sp. NBC_00687]MCX4912881.1 hypothetical protein [Streptomyces sp. NBC_00687]